MPAIYEPKGAAREYAELALNLYAGCSHGCTYCYAPAVLRKSRAEFHAAPRPRPGILEQLAKEAPTYAGDPREVLLSFTSDPYQPCEQGHHLTRAALEILVANGVKVGILTKRPQLAFLLDGDLLLRGRVRLGTTVVFADDASRQKWEPGAGTIPGRLLALEAAKRAGLSTWVSVEPVIDPVKALDVIRCFAHAADEFRIGKINHQPDLERAVNWPQFVADATKLCQDLGVRFMLKQSLARYL